MKNVAVVLLGHAHAVCLYQVASHPSLNPDRPGLLSQGLNDYVLKQTQCRVDNSAANRCVMIFSAVSHFSDTIFRKKIRRRRC